jgi:hypothetical protein
VVSSPLLQIPSTAVDIPGLSVATSVRSPTDPRSGAVYDNVNLAAAVPVHFHPMTAPALGGGTFMMINSQRWTAATPSTTDPGYASAFTADDTPNWAMVNATTGGAAAVNSGFSIPMKTPVETATLTAAVSQGTNMLYLLNSTDVGAVVQHFHNNTAINTLNPINEEIVPAATGTAGEAIVFDSGIDYSQATDPYMVFYGAGSETNHVYMARKRWSRVGDVGIGTRITDGQWEFFNGTGWILDSTGLAPLQSMAGPLVSIGPMSFAHYGINRTQKGKTISHTLAVATLASGSVRTAQVYEALGGRPWTPLGAPIALGSAGSTYLGGTAQLQGQLGANPAMVDPMTSSTAIPYLVATKLTSGSTHQIHVDWGLIPLARQS